MTFSKMVYTEVNEDVEVMINKYNNFIEIWQGNDLVEFEVERIPELIAALSEAQSKSKGMKDEQ